MRQNAAKLRGLLNDYLTALDQLRPFGIESIADYAEYLFEQALGGKRVRRGMKGYDVMVPRIGRIQVKHRRLPADGRIEERMLLGDITCDGCDRLGAVIFNNDLTIKKATLVPYDRSLRQLIAVHPDPQKKIRFDLIAKLPASIDMTARLRTVQTA